MVRDSVNAMKKLEDAGVVTFPVSKYNLETEELYKKEKLPTVTSLVLMQMSKVWCRKERREKSFIF